MLSPIIALVVLVALPVRSQEPTRLSASHSNAGLELSWPATAQKSDGSVVRPYFELQRTFDLQRWQPIGERQRAAATAPGQTLNMTLALDGPSAFYRLLSIEPTTVAKLGSGGAEVFGYGEAFAQELQRVGQISPDQFAAMFPNSAKICSATTSEIRRTSIDARSGAHFSAMSSMSSVPKRCIPPALRSTARFPLVARK